MHQMFLCNLRITNMAMVLSLRTYQQQGSYKLCNRKTDYQYRYVLLEIQAMGEPRRSNFPDLWCPVKP